MSWQSLFNQAKMVEYEGDKIVGDLPKGDIDVENASKYSQIASFVRQYLQANSMFSSESVVMNTESVVAENKEADTNNDRMVLEDEDDSDHHNISNEDTDMTSDTPIIDSIVDIFAKTIDLNNQHLHTISNSSIKVRGSKKAHSKTEKHIFNKVGAKLRLKPITTIKSLKYRPLRRSTHKKHSKVSISNYDI